MKNVRQILLELVFLNEVRDGQAGRATFAIIARAVRKPFVPMSFNLQQSTKNVKGHGALSLIQHRGSMRCAPSWACASGDCAWRSSNARQLAQGGRRIIAAVHASWPPLFRQALEIDQLGIARIKILDAAAG